VTVIALAGGVRSLEVACIEQRAAETLQRVAENDLEERKHDSEAGESLIE